MEKNLPSNGALRNLEDVLNSNMNSRIIKTRLYMYV